MVFAHNKYAYLRPMQQQHVIINTIIKSTTAPPTDAPIMIPSELLESSPSLPPINTLVLTEKNNRQ